MKHTAGLIAALAGVAAMNATSGGAVAFTNRNVSPNPQLGYDFGYSGQRTGQMNRKRNTGHGSLSRCNDNRINDRMKRMRKLDNTFTGAKLLKKMKEGELTKR